MSWYGQRVERDLKRWQEAGWVSDTGATAIRADLASRKSMFGAATILAMLGAVLFGFAIMSFVASNWDKMSKLSRLLLLLAALWACYGGAIWLMQRRLVMFAEAAIVGAIAVYGASIMLIAQMYHLSGNPADAVLMWALGALLAAALIPSQGALATTFVLAVVWSWMERSEIASPHWPFLVLWLAAAALAAWMRWRPGFHLAAAALLVWLIPLGFLILDRHGHWVVVLIGMLVAAATVAAAPAIDRHAPVSAATFSYAVVTAFCGLYIMQFIDGRWFFGATFSGSIGRLVLLAVVCLAGLVGAMLWALRTDNRTALWIAYVAFALEIISLYFITFGTLLNTSLFFLVAAVLVSMLAFAAYRLHHRNPAAGVAA